MGTDYRLAYWQEAFSYACEEAGIWDAYNAATPEQQKAAAELIQGAVENQDQAFGPTPSYPIYDEMEQLKREHKKELERQERRFNVLLGEACRVARVDPDRVSVSETELIVHRN
jgi:hypothetical protein